MPLSPTDCFDAKPGIIETDLESELILLDPDSQQMFSLNPVGRMIWRQIGSLNLGALADTVAVHFAVEKSTALADASTLLGELLAARLIAPSTRGR